MNNSGVHTFFKFKHQTTSELFDLRTRFNGSNDGEIRALSAVSSNVPSCDILSALRRHQTCLESTPPIYKNLLEAKRSTKVKHLTDDNADDGYNSSKTGIIEACLRYDWSNKPVGFISEGNLGYFITKPFETVGEQRLYRFAADMLAKRYFIYTTESAHQFLKVMNSFMNGQLKLTANKLNLSYEIGEFLTFIIKYQNRVQLSPHSDEKPLTAADFAEIWSKMKYLLEKSTEVKTPNLRTVRNRYNALKKKVNSRTSVNWLAAAKIANRLNQIELSPATVAA